MAVNRDRWERWKTWERDLLLLEKKSFSLTFVDGLLKVSEYHHSGLRFISLNENQVMWLIHRLVWKSQNPGLDTRKIRHKDEVSSLALFEKSNTWGSFISVETRVLGKNRSYIVIPGGAAGFLWQQFAGWLSLNAIGSQPVHVASPPIIRSYAEVVKAESQDLTVSVIASLRSEIATLKLMITELSERFGRFTLGHSKCRHADFGFEDAGSPGSSSDGATLVHNSVPAAIVAASFLCSMEETNGVIPDVALRCDIAHDDQAILYAPAPAVLNVSTHDESASVCVDSVAGITDEHVSCKRHGITDVQKEGNTDYTKHVSSLPVVFLDNQSVPEPASLLKNFVILVNANVLDVDGGGDSLPGTTHFAENALFSSTDVVKEKDTTLVVQPAAVSFSSDIRVNTVADSVDDTVDHQEGVPCSSLSGINILRRVDLSCDVVGFVLQQTGTQSQDPVCELDPGVADNFSANAVVPTISDSADILLNTLTAPTCAVMERVIPLAVELCADFFSANADAVVMSDTATVAVTQAPIIRNVAIKRLSSINKWKRAFIKLKKQRDDDTYAMWTTERRILMNKAKVKAVSSRSEGRVSSEGSPELPPCNLQKDGTESFTFPSEVEEVPGTADESVANRDRCVAMGVEAGYPDYLCSIEAGKSSLSDWLCQLEVLVSAGSSDEIKSMGKRFQYGRYTVHGLTFWAALSTTHNTRHSDKVFCCWKRLIGKPILDFLEEIGLAPCEQWLVDRPPLIPDFGIAS